MLMSVLVKAEDVPAASRLEYWQHTVDEILGPLEVRMPSRGVDLQDQLRIGDAGAVRLAELRSHRPGGAQRSRRHIRRSDLDVSKIDVLACGHGIVEQDGRQAHLWPGDLAFVDLSRPVNWIMSPMQMIAVVFPRRLLPLRRDETADLTAVRIPGNEGTGALVSTLARQLIRGLDEWATPDGPRLGGALLDLVTVTLAARLNREEQLTPETRQRALLIRIQTYIEQQLADPRLSPDTIAAAQYISPRYLYKLFETQQTTVAAWIRQRRLEHCRRELLQPGSADKPVSAIAARWGFSNAAHFSRVFRTQYGIAPTQYRTAATGSG